MPDHHNDRRDNSDMRELFAEIKRQGDDCNQQYLAILGKFEEVSNNQASFGSNIKSINSQLAEIKTTVAPMSAEIAVSKSKIDSLNSDKLDIYKHITSIKDAIRDNGGKVIEPSFWLSENGKYLIWGAIALTAGLAGINIQGLLP